MSKILYTIGTEVQVRDWRIKEQDRGGVLIAPGKRVVIDYLKGEEKPYVVSRTTNSSLEHSVRFSVDEIKSFRAESKQTVNNDRPTTTKSSGQVAGNSVSISDVQEIVDKAVKEATEKLRQENAESVSDTRREISKLHDHLVTDAGIIAEEVVHNHILDEDA